MSFKPMESKPLSQFTLDTTPPLSAASENTPKPVALFNRYFDQTLEQLTHQGTYITKEIMEMIAEQTMVRIETEVEQWISQQNQQRQLAYQQDPLQTPATDNPDTAYDALHQQLRDRDNTALLHGFHQALRERDTHAMLDKIEAAHTASELRAVVA